MITLHLILIIFAPIGLLGGAYLWWFLFGHYIPEAPTSKTLPTLTPVRPNDQVVLYGADSAPGEDKSTTHAHPEIYRSFVNIVVQYKGDLDSRLLAFIHGGDIVSHRSTKTLTEFIAESQPIINANIPILLATGNEEGERGRKFLVAKNLLSSSEPYYRYDFPALISIIINTEYPLQKGTAQYQFLEHELQRAQEKPLLIIMHHPYITHGFHDNHFVEWKRLRFANDIRQLFKRESKKILAVIQSDDHDFQRLVVDEIPVFVSGGLGEGLRVTHRGPETQVAIDGTFHYLEIASNTQRARITAVRFSNHGILGVLDTIDIPLSKVQP